MLQGKYYDAARCLSLIPAGRAGLQNFLKKIIRKEVTALSKKKHPKIRDLKNFAWEDHHAQAEDTAPYLYGVVRSALSKCDGDTT